MLPSSWKLEPIGKTLSGKTYNISLHSKVMTANDNTNKQVCHFFFLLNVNQWPVFNMEVTVLVSKMSQ